MERSQAINQHHKKHRSFAGEANFDRISLLKEGSVTTHSTSEGTTVVIKFRE